MRIGVLLISVALATGCDDGSSFDNPCDPANLDRGRCTDPDVAHDGPLPDAAPDARPDVALDVPRDVALDAAAPDSAPDMAPDMAPDAAIPDAATPDAAIPDAAIPCENPAFNPACVGSADQEQCAANGGEWAVWTRGGEPSCDCLTQDANCPCNDGSQCDRFCFVPRNEAGGGCQELPARCWERTRHTVCYCDADGQFELCP